MHVCMQCKSARVHEMYACAGNVNVSLVAPVRELVQSFASEVNEVGGGGLKVRRKTVVHWPEQGVRRESDGLPFATVSHMLRSKAT